MTEVLQNQAEERPTLAPKTVLYCGVCSFPPEYCEFGSSLTKCKAWLEEEHPDIFEALYSEAAVEKQMANVSINDKEKVEKEAMKKQAKEEAKAERELKKKLASKVFIKRIERNKRKYVTAVQGLDTFGVDQKKAAKLFANKFATGSSVTKALQGGDEIVIQGDVSDEVFDLILETYKDVPEDNIELTEEKFKKK